MARLKTLVRRAALLTLIIGAGYLLLLGAARWTPLPAGLFAPASKVVEFADGSVMHVFLSPDDKWRIHRPLEEIDPDYVQAVIQLEDRRFYAHGGVDLLAVVRAAVTNLSRGRVVSGASTITMQLVRVREPRPRTVPSKLIEAFRAMQIEARYSKPEILALYLTYVPYGKNVEGVEAAALSYFRHRARALSNEEIATLLAVPQNPTKRRPHPAHRARLEAARAEVAQRLGLPLVGATPVPTSMAPFPRHAPHAARQLIQTGGRRVQTTLSRGAQKTTASILTAAHRRLVDRSIHNGAAVVIEHATAEVKALVGNPDFFADRGGQIAGFSVPRSPGSALKPFIYAMAVDRGMRLPDHLVLDVPVEYGAYSPKNYDGGFAGLVSLEDALSRSLNVPFVNLLAEITVDDFIGTLQTWGVEGLVEAPGHYGLSAAIGGIELTPMEMAALYAALARDGQYLRPTLVEGADRPGSARAFSPGAAHLTRRALARRDRPDFPARRRYAPSRGIHWKTGTSYGHRDAWAIGSSDRYTVAIWLGNFDNRPSVHLVGADAAGPILFDVLEALGTGAAEGPPPSDLTSVRVCSFSGHLATSACPHTKKVLGLTERVPRARCPYHVEVDVDVATGLGVNGSCRAGRAVERRTFLRFPSALGHLAASARSLPAPPDLDPACEVVAARPPAILSPSRNKIVTLLPGVRPDEQEIPLAAEGSGRTASWFVDGRFIGTVEMSERLWWTPEPGDHAIVVTDDTGASARRLLSVRSL